MTDPVRVGVVGTSWWAELMYLPVFRNYPRAELVAVCGRNRERAELVARQHGIPQAFTDYRKMIAQAGLDAIAISTPDDLHYPIGMAALDAGLHVLCEKPLALDVTQARAMYEKAEAAGVRHMVLFTYRWLPHYRRVRELIDQGYLGRLYHCSMRYVHGFGHDPQDRWRLDPRRGRGVLGDIGSHMIDLARWYAGEVSSVGAHLAVFGGRVDERGQPLESANDSVALTLVFQSGAQAAIQLSSVVHVGDRGQEQRIVLSGSAGTLEVYQTFSSAEVYGARAGERGFTRLFAQDYLAARRGAAEPDMTAMLAPFREQAIGPRLFVDAIAEKRAVAPSFYDGLKAQEVIDAAFESHQRGCTVSF